MKKTNQNYRFFLKFGKKEHIEALQKGDVFMNTLAYFQTAPEENLIGDKFEGIKHLLGFRDLTLNIAYKGKDIIFKSVGTVYAHPTERYEGNIYCLYGAHEQMLESRLKDNLGELPIGNVFGDCEYFAIINNPKEFVRRIEVFCASAGYNMVIKGVNYIDFNTYQGVMTPFVKRDLYKGQNEIRIFIENDIGKSLAFNIGDISDICTIASTKGHEYLKYKTM